jgi:serine/threonine protein kinase
VPGFRVGGLLGHGGFGAVFAAARVGDGATGALKVVRAGVAGARTQLEREAEALRAIGPPAVPALLGQGVLADGSPYLAMELVEGPSLAERLSASGGALPPAELAGAVLAALDALARLHAAGFAHGDLKPENVLLGGQPPTARLIDLGLAVRLGAAAGEPATALAGSPEYMSPEQCQGLPPDARSDVYAAGALLLELATGRPPFFGPAAEVRHAHVNLRPPRPGTLGAMPPALAEAIHELLADEPRRRLLGQLGRARVVANFSHRRMARLTLEMYARALGARADGHPGLRTGGGPHADRPD